MTPEVAAALLTEASRWVWDTVGKDLTDKTNDLFNEQWQKFEWR